MQLQAGGTVSDLKEEMPGSDNINKNVNIYLYEVMKYSLVIASLKKLSFASVVMKKVRILKFYGIKVSGGTVENISVVTTT